MKRIVFSGAIAVISLFSLSSCSTLSRTSASAPFAYTEVHPNEIRADLDFNTSDKIEGTVHVGYLFGVKVSGGREYAEELIARHVSGRLKVAPEHTSEQVLRYMRKPSFDLFYSFNTLFEKVNRREGLPQQLIPYFISSHPGCTEEAMAELAVATKHLHFHLEQVQDFTPTPMTLATEMYYTGIDPYNGEKVYTARSAEQKLSQRKYFFWYKREYEEDIRRSLTRLHRKDLIKALYGDKPYKPQQPAGRTDHRKNSPRNERRRQPNKGTKNNRKK